LKIQLKQYKFLNHINAGKTHYRFTFLRKKVYPMAKGNRMFFARSWKMKIADTLAWLKLKSQTKNNPWS